MDIETNWHYRDNLSMLTDFYELTMAGGYLKSGMRDRTACFDLFFRNVPEKGGYAIMAGVEQIVDYLENLRFEEGDLQYLKSLGSFEDEFIDYLRNFEFKCSVWAVPEGVPIFPSEPIVKVVGPLMQCQMIETMLLVTINHQCLIATKSSRIVRAAQGRAIAEFGARRAQGYDAAVLGARAAYIGGCAGTSCTIAAQLFDIPALGTMAHSWVQSFDNEYESFCAYADAYPDNVQLLVDTYDTLHQGIPNAIRCAKEYMAEKGLRLKAIRIDSGDLAYLSIKAREMLDEAGLEDCKITVSNALDEKIINDLLLQGAQIDNFGVGERLITSRAEPVFGGVYKLSAIEDSKGEIQNRMKVSDNPEKITNPCMKNLFRLYNRKTGMAEADLITMHDEKIDDSKELEIFDPIHTWKKKVLTDFEAVELLKPLFVKGKKVHESKNLAEIREVCEKEMGRIWDSVKRYEYPQPYYVDLSEKLWQTKDEMLRAISKRN